MMAIRPSPIVASTRLGRLLRLTLAALMSLNAARLPARLDLSGNLTALADQDRSQFVRAGRTDPSHARSCD
jgi:predicted RNA polymerase sigma factor